MSRQPLSDADKRLVDLATGFALGELEKDELGELHQLIQDGDRQGNNAALLVWQTLGISVDLRAVLDKRFADTVLSKLEGGSASGSAPGEARESASRSFLRTLAARMGIARPALEPVTAPPLPPRRLALPRLVAAALLGVLALGLLAAYFLSGRGAVEVLGVTGSVTAEGRALVPGDSLPWGPVIVADDGALELEWKPGHRARISGPANLLPRERGLSLSSGTAWVITRGEFTLGLPDGQAQTSAPSTVAAVIRDNRSMLGVSSGTAKVTVRYQRHVLHAGNAMVLDGPVFPWQPELKWKDSPPETDGQPVLRTFINAPAAPAWHIRFRVRWNSADDLIRFRFPPNKASPASTLELRPGSVTVGRTGKPSRRYRLEGAPMLARDVLLISPHAGKPHLVIDGLDEPITVPDKRIPQAIELAGKPELAAFAAGSGPNSPPRTLSAAE